MTENKTQLEERLEIESMINFFRNIILFPGPLEEFEKKMGQKYSFFVLDSQERLDYNINVLRDDFANPFGHYLPDFQKRIREYTITALVKVKPVDRAGPGTFISGYPVINRYLEGNSRKLTKRDRELLESGKKLY